MGKGKRLKELKKLTDIIVHGDGLESITDELIPKLIKEQGMKKSDLEGFQKEGAKYSASRTSFFFPSEINGFKKIK